MSSKLRFQTLTLEKNTGVPPFDLQRTNSPSSFMQTDCPSLFSILTVKGQISFLLKSVIKLSNGCFSHPWPRSYAHLAESNSREIRTCFQVNLFRVEVMIICAKAHRCHTLSSSICPCLQWLPECSNWSSDSFAARHIARTFVGRGGGGFSKKTEGDGMRSKKFIILNAVY